MTSEASLFSQEESTIQETDITYHEIIGFGADGEVHRITWKSEHGDVEAAAKKIKIPSDPSRIKQLKFEIQIALNFKHENVISYYGHVVTETHVILVMEHAAKGSLFRHLKSLRKKASKTQISSEQIHSWAIQAARGIQYMRKASLVHRDIKSPNLLIMSDNTLKLCDFGLAKFLPETKATLTLKGTPRWLAPEVWKDSKLSPKADVFAFGIVLWELITGDEPFEGMRPEHVLYSVAFGNKRPDIPPRCPDVYRTLMPRCWNGDRDQRPTIDEIVAILEGPKEAFGLPPGPPTLPTIARSRATKLTVSWTTPDDTGASTIIGYDVEYRIAKSPEKEWLKANDDLVSRSSLTITGLKEQTCYEIRVTAVNNGGHGPQSDTVIGLTDTPGPPKLPTIASSRATKLTVSWTTPDDTGASPIIGYDLEYRIANSPEKEWLKANDDLVSGSSLTITGLKERTCYEIRVTAVNNGGHGPQSDTVIGLTVGTSPGRYVIFVAVVVVIVAYILCSMAPHPEDFSANHSWTLERQFAHTKAHEAHVEGAQSIAWNPASDEIAVADWFTRKVMVYNSAGILKPNGTLHTPLLYRKSHPRDVAISSNGSFFVTNETPHIRVFDSSYNFSHLLESSHMAAEYSRLSGITFTQDGQLLVGECRHKSISIHSKEGTRLDTFRTVTTPRYLAVTPQGTVVVSSWEPHRVDIMTLNGDVLHTLKPPKGVTRWRPTGVSCSDDFIFVGNDDTSAPDEYGIYCYSFSGEYLGVATKEVVNPTGVAVSKNGIRIIVAQWERGNPSEGRGLHGVKIFTKDIPITVFPSNNYS